jgi:hypothetical protein
MYIAFAFRVGGVRGSCCLCSSRHNHHNDEKQKQQQQQQQHQGECCGVFKETYGAKPGQGSSQCGLMMYNELLAAIGNTSDPCVCI